MSNRQPTDAQIRRRWINLGEFVAVAGLVISALALWNSWSDEKSDDRTSVVAIEKARAIPLALRGKVLDEGKAIVVTPVEGAHALDSATLTREGQSVEIGSDGMLGARAVEALVGKAKDEKAGAISVKVDARYIEAGRDKSGRGTYRIRYRWEGGCVFGGKELRLVGWSRG